MIFLGAKPPIVPPPPWLRAWGQRSMHSVAYVALLELDCEEADAVNQPDERDDSL